MIRSTIISSLVLSLVLVAGCKKDPEGTTPPADGETASNDGKKPGKKPKGGDADKPVTDGETGGDEQDPTKKVCPAEIAEFPEAYFADTVLLRLPKNVTIDNFVEMAPGFARISSEVESVSCIPDMPGAMISYMALGAFPEDKAKTMTVWRDETLEAFGYAGATFSEEQLDEGKRMYQAVLEVPPAEGKPEPAKALFRMVSAQGFMYAIVLETHPEAWNAMKETFNASAGSLKFLPPA